MNFIDESGREKEYFEEDGVESQDSLGDLDELDQDKESIPEKLEQEESRVFSEDEYGIYVVFITKNSEMSLYRSLLDIAKNSEDDILEVYLPEESIRKYKDNKEIIQKQPLMNYLFVKCRSGLLETTEFKRKINKKYRVIGTVSEEELSKIKIENESAMNSKGPEFLENTRVEIVNGSYAGIVGQVNSVSGNMVNLTISILGCPTTIEVYKSDLVPIED